MRIAVMGGTGTLGRAVIDRAVGAGHGVVAVSRRPPARLPAGVLPRRRGRDHGRRPVAGAGRRRRRDRRHQLAARRRGRARRRDAPRAGHRARGRRASFRRRLPRRHRRRPDRVLPGQGGPGEGDRGGPRAVVAPPRHPVPRARRAIRARALGRRPRAARLAAPADRRARGRRGARRDGPGRTVGASARRRRARGGGVRRPRARVEDRRRPPPPRAPGAAPGRDGEYLRSGRMCNIDRAVGTVTFGAWLAERYPTSQVTRSAASASDRGDPRAERASSSPRS